MHEVTSFNAGCCIREPVEASKNREKTLRKYASDIFLPYVAKQLNRVLRVDLVWDTYNADSLKSTARSKRGIGSRIHVGPNVPIHHKWSDFLRVGENKSSLSV